MSEKRIFHWAAARTGRYERSGTIRLVGRNSIICGNERVRNAVIERDRVTYSRCLTWKVRADA
jgi:hypothetical protein